MPRYSFMVRLPARSGAPVQTICARHGAQTLGDLLDVLNRNEFILVDQFVTNDASGEKSIGPVILGRRNIGRVREYQERVPYDG